MKILVATRRTQGARPNDFTWCVDGELVWLGFVCRRDEENPDGGCGCGRSFSGLSSGVATTTAEVRDVEFGFEDFVAAVADALDRQGWNPDAAEAVAAEIAEIAAEHPTGAVVERRLDDVAAREVTA